MEIDSPTKWFTVSRHDFMDAADYVEAGCKYQLPMAKCVVCGDSRGYPEVQYPELDAEKIFDKKSLRSLLEIKYPRAEWARFLELRERLAQFLPPGSMVLPKCGFGSMQAKFFRGFEGFGLGGLATLVASGDFLRRLGLKGFSLKTSPVEVRRARKGSDGQFFYIHAPPAGGSPPATGITFCAECRRPSRTSDPYGDEILAAATAPVEEPLFRLRHAPHILVFRHDLMECLVKDFALRGLHFLPLRIT